MQDKVLKLSNALGNDCIDRLAQERPAEEPEKIVPAYLSLLLEQIFQGLRVDTALVQLAREFLLLPDSVDPQLTRSRSSCSTRLRSASRSRVKASISSCAAAKRSCVSEPSSSKGAIFVGETGRGGSACASRGRQPADFRGPANLHAHFVFATRDSCWSRTASGTPRPDAQAEARGSNRPRHHPAP